MANGYYTGPFVHVDLVEDPDRVTAPDVHSMIPGANTLAAFSADTIRTAGPNRLILAGRYNVDDGGVILPLFGVACNDLDNFVINRDMAKFRQFHAVDLANLRSHPEVKDVFVFYGVVVY